jgi:hypothetical protein
VRTAATGFKWPAAATKRTRRTGNEGAGDRSWRLSPGMRDQPAKADQVVARIAGRQHGVVSVEQLRRAGLDKRAISRRVRTARLHPVHRGVYAVGHSRLTFDGRCMAAALALGDGAAVSHRSAAALWGMLPTHEGSIEITVPGDGGREKRKGIKVHRSSTLICRYFDSPPRHRSNEARSYASRSSPHRS